MNKNTIIISVLIGILLIIGTAYYYENYYYKNEETKVEELLNAEIRYPQAVELLREDPKKALDYCDRNTTIDYLDPGADCLAEVLCAADEIGKLKELCEVGMGRPPKNESEKQKLIAECVEIIKISCKNPVEALNICNDTKCFNAVSAIAISVRKDIEIAKEACHRIKGQKKDCYYNLVYSLVKMNKNTDEMLKICDLYGKEKLDNYESLYDCYILVAYLTSKRDINVAKDICNKISVKGVEYRQECVSNCLRDRDNSQEFCEEKCSRIPKNKQEVCLKRVSL